MIDLQFRRLARIIEYRLPTLPMDVVFDVGANVGQTVGAVRRSFPNAVVHAFEPVPATFAALAAATAGDPRVIATQAALGAAPGEALMTANGTSTLNRLVAADRRTRHPLTTVSVTTGDHICRARRIGRIDLLKIDAEGHDLEVLRGFGRMLRAQRISIIQVEAGLSPDNPLHVPLATFSRLLERRGYRLLDVRGLMLGKREQVYLRRCNAFFISQKAAAEHAITGAAADEQDCEAIAA